VFVFKKHRPVLRRVLFFPRGAVVGKGLVALNGCVGCGGLVIEQYKTVENARFPFGLCCKWVPLGIKIEYGEPFKIGTNTVAVGVALIEMGHKFVVYMKTDCFGLSFVVRQCGMCWWF
jgi:hypothetical protein